MTRLRAATYNVHKCRGMDFRTSVPRVSRVMKEVAADLIAVQEVFAEQVACLERGLEMRSVFGEVRKLNGQGYGNAVFSRLPIVEWEQYDLTVGGREPRQCLRVSVDQPGPLHFFAVHLGTSFFERRQQAERLLSPEMLEKPEFKGARVVAGDFNEWTRGMATQMMSHYLQSADVATHLNRSRTYPGLLPVLHLDHIYYDRQFHLREMHLHRTPAALSASDHLPLTAVFTRNPDCQS